LRIKKGAGEGFTAPPAKLGLAGGFRTLESFHGFGHGDSGSFFKDVWTLDGFSKWTLDFNLVFLRNWFFGFFCRYWIIVNTKITIRTLTL